MFKIIGGLLISELVDFLCRRTRQNILRDVNHLATVETLNRNLMDLRAKALDVEDQIKNAELFGQKKRKREVENWLEETKKLEDEIHGLEFEVRSEEFVGRFLGEDRASQLKERVVALIEQSRHFGELALEACETRGQELLTTNLVGKGYEENLKTIWKMLRDDNVTSIGIYGMGGVGKTSLTKHIHNRLVRTQKRVIWVTISQESSVRMLQDKIAHAMRIDLSNESDENKRAARMHRELSSFMKNFVLILDDVWKNISLEKVGIPLGVEGSKLIITTRLLQVCHQIGCQRVIPVKTLGTNEAWKLFSDTLGQEVTLSTPQVEEFATSMANVCAGLPLGIITLAASMRGETAVHVWRNALEELQKPVMKHDDMEDHVFKVLKYSFDRLNPKHEEQGESNGGYTELQRCFLYCSLYPEDDMIEKEELVRKFISEELVDKRKTRRAQIDQGLTLLDKLVNVCLLESVGNSYVKMHDLVRAMALNFTRGKNMVLTRWQLEQIPDHEYEYWPNDAEKISLILNCIKEIPDGISPNCPNLSTLLLQLSVSLKLMGDSFFSRMHGLCVLDLSESKELTKLPSSLSDLERLKALLLGGCRNLVNVPHLGKLKALEELDLSFTAIWKVPQGMDELVNLKFLSMDGANALQILPIGLILKFPNLQCLHLPMQIEAPITEIKGLTKLEEFKGRVNNDADINRLNECIPLIRISS